MARLFGTDGVRGLAGTELTSDLAFRLGRAAVRVLGRRRESRPTLVVGRDTRESGEWLEDALVEGIRTAGGDVVIAGVQPTPAVAFLTTAIGASSGVVISASHNPAEYNGIKFFSNKGMKLPDDLEDEIEASLDVTAVEGRGRLLPLGEGEEQYLQHLVSGANARLDGLSVVVDCANGAASSSSPDVLRRLGAKVHVIFDEPDGWNINDGCGTQHPQVVAEEVVRRGADVGVAHDGDADRAMFADARGEVIDGDQVLAACAIDMREAGTLTGNMVVATVMSNIGFHRAMAAAGIEVVSTKVGDRYVLEEMLRSGAVLGGEQSGHVIFRDHATTGDGILTAVRFLSLLARKEVSATELASCMRRFPQVIVNVPVIDREALEESTEIWEMIRGAQQELGDSGRVVVRASGTEPLVRVMVEAETDDLARRHADVIAAAVRRNLSAA